MSESVLIKFHRDAKALYGEGIAYATAGSLGLDLRASIETESITVHPKERVTIPSGISIEIQEENVGGFVYSRSGLGAKHGITVAQGVGVIDRDYRGEILIILLNTSDKEYTIFRGDRVAQLLFQPAFRLKAVEAQTLSNTERSSGGFGHTGV